MNTQQKIVTIFGGTGFAGRHIVRRLAKAGYVVKIATRAAERAYFLRPCGTPGQVVPFACDYNDASSIAGAIDGAAIVINCIGILYEQKRGQFVHAHVDTARALAAAAHKAGVRQFIHISALGCDKGSSRYAASKREGEKAVLESFPAATILRPSVIFGPEDKFFNMFAELSRYMPALPLIGGGKTRFQPVYVGDIADAVMAAIGHPGTAGRIYELGGAEVMSFRDIYEHLFRATGRRRCLISLPFGIAKIQATFLQMLPHPLLTRDQVESLKTDNVVADDALKFADLGITAKPLDGLLRDYLEYSRPGGHFADKKRA